MSDEKKPFAECRPSEYDGSHDLFVAGRFMASEPIGDLLGDGPVLPTIAAHINAAVEQREAKLRGALADLIRDAGQLVFECDGVVGTRMPSRPAYNTALETLNRARAALGPGPGYVGEHEHALLMNAFRDLQVVVDALDGGVTGQLAPFLEAMGLRKSVDWWADIVTDEQLATEVKRRGAIEKTVHVFAEYEYGWRDGRTSVTGRALCGLVCDYGGRWTAITQNDFNSGGRADCPACLRVARERDAALAMIRPA